MAQKTVQGIKLVVRAPEQSYSERNTGSRKVIAYGELYAFRRIGIKTVQVCHQQKKKVFLLAFWSLKPK